MVIAISSFLPNTRLGRAESPRSFLLLQLMDQSLANNAKAQLNSPHHCGGRWSNAILNSYVHPWLVIFGSSGIAESCSNNTHALSSVQKVVALTVLFCTLTFLLTKELLLVNILHWNNLHVSHKRHG